ncbi:MAG: T9SS type A sorting domain-containing protein [Flavobacteriales bacterium]|nr:T9SS type A sorting domain-containing protein [Flavobacteriales bacterium]
MKVNFKQIAFILLSLVFGSAEGNVVECQPAFPVVNDTVTIIFNASEGNGALKGTLEEVYIHTGLITEKSTSNTDWRYVQGNWGTDDSKVKMVSIGGDLYKFKFHIRSFYGLPSGENALKLAFVFRNKDGSKVGRAEDNSDIFYEISEGAFTSRIFPDKKFVVLNLGDSLEISGMSSESADLEININGTSKIKVTGNTVSYTYKIGSTCVHLVVFSADNGIVKNHDTLYLIVPDLSDVKPLPAGTEDGVTYLSDNKIRFSLFAPQKKHVYLIGSFNNWVPSCTYQLHKTPDQNRYWLEISGFIPGVEYAFQYLVDGELRIADPYSQVVLDPFNDKYISPQNYPGLMPYPVGKTSDIAGMLFPGKQPFIWKSTNYKRPTKEKLVIYEILIRDFISERSFKVLKDSLSYLKNLGVNCIELMPVSEYEGNNSWGYNVSFHGALDKEYGTIEDYKAFIDACHQENIAVVMDVVFNHAFSQNSLCRLYWDDANFRPAANNPWLNVIEKHPFNVGYDFNHESNATQVYMDKILKYWQQEFKVDGFRFDLSKGFTQKNTGSDVSAWGHYDQSRIDLLKRMMNKLKANDSTGIYILEHFADNSEEKVLESEGFMLWGNMVHNFNEATMGYAIDLSWADYRSRGWKNPSLVSYLESHDEERLMYKNLNYGNTNGNYSVKNLTTALQRNELAGVFFFGLPGPKMFWQFGELGYDVSIDLNGRLGNKPIRWSYLNEKNRKYLHDVWSTMIHLKTEQKIFNTTDYQVNLASIVKSIYLNDSGHHMVIVGNFDVKTASANLKFQKTGKWYDYFSQDSIEISKTDTSFNLLPGEYRVYSNYRMNAVNRPLGISGQLQKPIRIYPNPAHEIVYIDLGSNFSKGATIELVDMKGRNLKSLSPGHDKTICDLSEFEPGLYLFKIRQAGKINYIRLMKE